MKKNELMKLVISALSPVMYYNLNKNKQICQTFRSVSLLRKS